MGPGYILPIDVVGTRAPRADQRQLAICTDAFSTSYYAILGNLTRESCGNFTVGWFDGRTEGDPRCLVGFGCVPPVAQSVGHRWSYHTAPPSTPCSWPPEPP